MLRLKRFALGGAMVALLMVGACAGDDGPAGSGPSQDVPKSTVVVTLKDSVPLDVLQNHDDKLCRSKSVTAALSGNDTPVQVTLRDAAGTVVATQDLPDVGGEFASGTCTWPVEFTVEHSDFYEVTVTALGKDTSATGQTVDGAASLEVIL